MSNTQVSFFPALEDGETLYSVCSRFHDRSGYSRPGMTGDTLFGFEHAGANRDIPIGLAHLSAQVGSGLPDVEAILRKTTVAGLYMPFFSPTRVKKLVRSCAQPPGTRAKAQFGLLGSRVVAKHALKQCPACIEEDNQRVGFAYWHLAHQYPGAWICTRHTQVLREMPDDLLGCHTWVRPKQCASGPTPPSFSSLEIIWLKRISSVLNWIASHSILNVDSMRHLAIRQLFECGVISSMYALSPDTVKRWFCRTFPLSLFEQIPELSDLRDGHWIRELLLGRRANHPLRWAIFFTCLFSDNEVLLLEQLLLSPNLDHRGQALLAFDSPLIPTYQAPRRVYRIMEAGIEINNACDALSVTRGVLMRWLDQDHELRATWERARLVVKRKHCRDVLLSARKKSPELSRAALSKSIAAEYWWLDRHDKEWLKRELPILDSRWTGQRELF